MINIYHNGVCIKTEMAVQMSGRRLLSIRTKNSRDKDSFFPTAAGLITTPGTPC